MNILRISLKRILRYKPVKYEITSPDNKARTQTLGVKLASWHPSGAYNCEVVPWVLKNLCTLVLIHCETYLILSKIRIVKRKNTTPDDPNACYKDVLNVTPQNALLHH